ncbi:hypothetical protein BN2497_4699 [Janthinobacterium sp. CG23_2]|nr:hypothetical protein BN2497_4699 [Janthinobacterium sp. CG23_2]CUU28747.1 hypothetical protein BN3177_4699 [Janthinobacterium sp. CG23_2]
MGDGGWNGAHRGADRGIMPGIIREKRRSLPYLCAPHGAGAG